MAYSAGSGGPPPAGITGQNNNQTNTTQYQNDNVEETTNVQNANSDLQMLFDARKNKLPLTNPVVNAIHKSTERAVKNLVTKANEFYDENSKMVKSGTPYHIHYTSQLTQHFMTGAEHSHLSKLIYPLKSDVTQFTYYNSLNKQKPLKLNSQTTIPTEDDYRKKSYKRYFAKQSNDKTQPSFEISEGDFSSSPLYEYVELTWNIAGEKDIVYSKNIREINRASRTMPSIKRILSPFQFYRFEEDLGSAEDKRNALLAMLDFMKANFADFLANYSTTSQSNIITNTGAGSPGTCSLGADYTTKAACEAAGGTWTDGIPGIGVDADGNYLGNDGNQTELDAGGNIIEAPEQC
tara:strand:- start:258 stop:1307 length:1050 start_codon:yes stop_codon:yes gene_type:complete